MANPVVSLKQLLHRHEYRICAQQISSSSRVRWHLGHDEGITLDLVLGADSLQPSAFNLQPSAISHQPSAFSFQLSAFEAGLLAFVSPRWSGRPPFCTLRV